MFNMTVACSTVENEGLMVNVSVDPTVLYWGTNSSLEKLLLTLLVCMLGK